MKFDNKEQSPDYLKGIFETASEGILFADVNGHILRCNPSLYTLLGYEKDELNGTLFSEIVHKTAEVQKFTSSIKLYHFQVSSEFPLRMELINKKGTTVPVNFRSTLVKDNKQEVVEAIGIVEALTKDQGERTLKQTARETQETLQNILANSGDAIWVVDVSGHITVVNEALLQMLGYQEDEILGKHVTGFAPFEGSFTTNTGEEVCFGAEYINSQMEVISELFKKGKVTNHEQYLIRKDRKIVLVEVTLSVLKNQDGERTGGISIFRDITERKLAEARMRESENRLNNIIESSLDGITVSDHMGFITRVNKSFLELIDFEEEEVIGKHIAEFTPYEEGTYESTTGELIEVNEEFLNNVMVIVEKLFKERKLSNWESYYLRKDRKIVPVETTIAYFYNEKGGIIGSVGISRNITERRKAVRELRETKEFLERVIGNTKDGILIVDEKGYILSSNIAMEQMSGFSNEEMVGKHAAALVTDEKGIKTKILEKTSELFEKGFTAYEARYKTKDGKFIDVECISSMIKNEKEEYIAGVSIIRDISERKRAEKKINEYQNQLRSMASQLTLTEERERRRIATDLHDRIGQALAISKIKLGGLRESTSSIGLNGDVDEVRNLIEQTIQDTRSLIFDLCPPFLYELGFEKALEWLVEEIQKEHGVTALFKNDEKPKPLDDDVRVLLFRTVNELLINIVKHAHAQKAKVSLKRDKDNIQINVEDDGIGFDVSKIQNHVDKTGGFGLFRIRERLNYLGGQLKVESEPKHGTRVSLVVPMKYDGQTKKEEMR